MKGMTLAKEFYETCGKPMLEKDFPQLLPFIAAGLFGSGSECFGYDDGISRDHDFEPAFMILLPWEDVIDRRSAFLLERAYAKLPKEFKGFKRADILPVGGARHGVLRIRDVILEKTGTPDGELSLMQWFRIPEQSLAEAVNGEIFYDGYGEISAIREKLACFPENIRKKKLAGHLLLMAQSGQYNYMRCVSRGETGAAQMAAFEFAKSAMAVIFLLNNRYMPYYKWGFRAMRDLRLLSSLAEDLEYLITTGNDPRSSAEKNETIERIAGQVIRELDLQNLSAASGGDLEKHAYAVNDTISDSLIRNMHILDGV